MVESTAPGLAVIPVTDRRGLRDFIALPRRIYAGDTTWIAPLDFEVRQRITPHNPFFYHARVMLWVAYRDGLPVGRISAQVDDLYLQRYPDRTGYFGMLEADDDPKIFQALFQAAEGWLRQQGMTAVRGPFNLSINEEVGLLVEGFATPPFIMMGHHRPYYGGMVEGQGYARAVDTFTYNIRPDFDSPRVMQRLVEKVAGGVTVRCIRRRQLAEDFEIMRDIFNDAWVDNWGFVPFTREEFADMAKTLALLLDDDNVQIAELDGRPVAFIVLLPNVNEAARDLNGRLLPFGWAKLLWRLKVRRPHTARVPLMGVRREFQRTRLGPALAFLVIDAVRKPLAARGVNDVEMGWILEGNDGMRNIIETIGGRMLKRYRVYQKQL